MRTSLQPASRFPRLLSRRSLIVAGLATLGATAGVAVPLSTRGSFYPGTSVSGVDISEHSFETARAELQRHFAGYEQHAADFVFEEQRWSASLADLGFSIDYDATLDIAYSHGRDGSVLERYSGVLLNTINETYPVVFTHDEDKLRSFLQAIGPEIKGAARNARLYMSEGEIRILEDRDGRQLDIDQAMQDVTSAVESAEFAEISLTTQPVVSQVTVADLEQMKVDTETLISDSVSVTSGSTRWTIPRDMLVEVLTFPPVEESLVPPWLDAERLATGLQGIADEMYRAPQNAVLGWNDGLEVIENDIPGQEVDVVELSEAIAAAAATTDQRNVTLPLIELPAEVRADNLDTLGITHLLAEGSSAFYGSSPERAANVRISGEHLTHTLIPPGGTLSFNDALGPISLDNGFVEGKIIRGEWIESDLGGGACQASTTVFRAALYAGLAFEEWNPHSFRLAFYEADGSPPGIDAAIYQPNNEYEWELDLKFVNPTENWMLMEMSTQGEVAVTSLFGSPTGYEVEVTVPYISDPIKPDPPMEREDDRLEKGQREQLTTEANGYKVIMHRVVKREGQIVREEDFESNYEPQRETWLIGPGTKRKFPEDPDAEPTETATA